jgi:hypothetical protein
MFGAMALALSAFPTVTAAADHVAQIEALETRFCPRRQREERRRDGRSNRSMSRCRPTSTLTSPTVADDFAAIRARVQELRREHIQMRQQSRPTPASV